MTSFNLTTLQRRPADAHKGDFGHVLIVAGSAGMAGAAALAGKAALRAGSGLTTVACPAAIQPTVAAMEPCYMTWGWPDTLATTADEIMGFAKRCQCVAIGPGLGRSDATRDLVLSLYRQLEMPMIVDADAIVALAAASEIPHREAATVLTPHPGEFRRLVHDDQLSVDDGRRLASEWARSHGVVMVLKGHQTLVTDGRRSYVNTTGNPGMATGGTGDVLTGTIAGLVAQSLPVWDAACLAVHVHGLAGDLAREDLGEVSLIASDLVRYLPAAFQRLPGPVSRRE